MDKLIKKFVHHNLSDSNIQKLTDYKYNIVLYQNIPKYKTLNKLLGKNNGVVILYETEQNIGHWICMWLDIIRNVIMYFDSYGFKPDGEAKFAPFTVNYLAPYLSQILQKDGRDIDYNHYRLQKWSSKVNTCGRWVAIRLQFKNLNHEQFHKLFTNNKLDNDIIITYLTFMNNDEDKLNFD